jgi:nucleotide-binding universal stress UspA family protein
VSPAAEREAGRMVHVMHATDAEQVPAPWLRSVVCGVDGTAAGREAARQAAELTGAHGRLELVAVTPGAGLAAFVLPAATAARVLFEAQNVAQLECPGATTSMVAAGNPADGLIRAAAGADLLAVGCDAVGRVPTAVLRRAPCSVLLARRPPDLPLCELILVAGGDDAAHHIAAAHLAFEHGSDLETVSPMLIATAAAVRGCGLIVVSDDALAVQIARAAPCSVLVVRQRD